MQMTIKFKIHFLHFPMILDMLKKGLSSPGFSSLLCHCALQLNFSEPCFLHL